MSSKTKDALTYHCGNRPGKIEVISSKPCATQLDLSLAYTPGVAAPCLAIKEDIDQAFEYTIKGNLVAVITNGTAVLGLGNIGPLASKPVMEGKGVLFKRFADIDVFDIELNTTDPDRFVETVKTMAGTFGGINLEDIRAPECFYIEERLREELDIPVFHDDQHGTAIITSAAFLNGMELVKKDFRKAKIVFSGAGAAAIACAKLFVELGVDKENITMTDSRGVLYKGRGGMNPYKEEFARDTPLRTLGDAMRDADVFVGCSVRGLVTKEMVKSMADRPLIFALANPYPEITPEEVREVRDDAIVATGRSDYPNQVNNVLGFPFIFRGALDVRATEINEAMKVAATYALAELAKEDVPEDVLFAYSTKKIEFGPEYIIPKPFDSRVLYRVASAVAKAAMDSGVAQKPIEDFTVYEEHLERLLHPTRELLQKLLTQARRGETMRIVFPEGNHEKILRACATITSAKIARPILLGKKSDILEMMDDLGLEFPEGSFEIIDVWKDNPYTMRYAEEYQRIRRRKGVTHESAIQTMHSRTEFALMMVELGDADGCISGIGKVFSATIRPALQIIGLKKGETIASGMYMILGKNGKTRFFADTTINTNPTAEQLAHIAVSTADAVRQLGIEPRVAMLSHSNFGSVRSKEAFKVQEATRIAKELRPELIIDGEMRVSVATNPHRYEKDYPDCLLDREANVFIFPTLDAGNIGYQLMEYLSDMEVLGPILIGLNKPVAALTRGCDISTIINMTAITAVYAKVNKKLRQQSEDNV